MNMAIVAVFSLDNGEVLRVVSCPKTMTSLQAGDNEAVLLCASDISDDTHYVDLGTKSFREKAIQSLSVTADGLMAAVTGIAPGTIVTAGLGEVTADDGPTEIVFDLPGTHTIGLSGLVAYFDGILEVTVDV